jgi:hypothetical protein
MIVDFIGGEIKLVLLSGRNHDRCALSGKAERHLLAHAPRCARQQRHASREIE